MTQHVMVLGGGVIGLSCAFELKRRGFAVTVLEMGKCGGQASGAAAGMLAPYSENVEEPDPFFRLCLQSLLLYPEWQLAVKEASGLDFEYSATGSLYVMYHEADMLAMKSRKLWQDEHDAASELLDSAELRKLEPFIAPEAIGALRYPGESHVYAPGYVKALEEACRRTGVSIRDGLERIDITRWRDGVEVQAASTGETYRGDTLVVSNGAWAGLMESVFGMAIPIYPIRGQICAYETPDMPVRHMVFCSQGYVVGKRNGTLVCGASEDIAGFETTVTRRGIARLESWNGKLFPFLGGMRPFHEWAGLRPATQDGFPLLGRLSVSDSVLFAAGHYRNGILLSPATAAVVADLLEERVAPGLPLQAFNPERFSL
ncbi:glycine oxidase ThiO [Paenibacillus hemerocallicola]|uniref:glycine oxidase n=1 Tax=Paenibacillus hemerocallicola TaxID=1172614 RepID=A0A5C4TEP7_9BACL|nr:glycine oxidase ThiO [Paenibacillus hemerocallicola]TNJ67282.1 glycine oxidase ThiO [Paenibacillus hemerocallicola]